MKKNEKLQLMSGCCGGHGGSKKLSPEEIVQKFMPKLNEALFEILGEFAFFGKTELKDKDGQPYKVEVETLFNSILDHTNRVLKLKHEPSVKIQLSANVEGTPVAGEIKKGDILSLVGEVQKRKGKFKVKTQRQFVSLVDMTNKSVRIEEFEQDQDLVNQEFQLQINESGTQNYQMLVFTGAGKVEKS